MKILNTAIVALSILFSFLLPTQTAFAVPPYVFTVTQSLTSITATLTGAPNNTDEYILYNGTTAVPASTLVGIASSTKVKPTNGTIVWTISGRAFVNGTYNLHVEKLVPATLSSNITQVVVTDTKTVTVSTSGADFFTWPLAVTPGGQSAVISGTIDTSKYPAVDTLDVQMKYSRSAFGSTDPSDAAVVDAHKSIGGAKGVASDGKYYFELKNLDIKTKYNYRQIILVKNTATVLNSKVSYFDSTDGYVPAGSAQEQTLEASKTYHLLAPWPGLSKLYDPDLCLQKKANKSVPQDAICDINGFINFIFKTLIGLTAVVLVLRLMYEGYQYVVTDVPFLKASAKSGFFSALMGLLLALSAYLILNTINPKLVSNSFSVASVEVGVDDEIETSPGTIYDVGGDAKSCPEGFTDVTTFGTAGKINVCKSIATKLTSMLVAAKNANIILLGYGSRSTERQKQLRIAHGCPNDSTPSSSCHPPTARPGRSMHERGMAIDFNCNGTSINNHSNSCYVWLTAHAAEYGFKNLPSEPWHWSINGK